MGTLRVLEVGGGGGLYSEVVGPFWMIFPFQGFFGVLNPKKEKKLDSRAPGADLGGWRGRAKIVLII